MRYALMRKMDISNGQGVGVSLFVQGCPFHCKGCFNQETWDFNGGEEWTQETEDQFVALAARPFVTRISFLGGEPLAAQNVRGVFDLVNRLKREMPEKKIWIFSGYTWEDIMYAPVTRYTNLREMTVFSADVLVDGQFELDKQDINHKTVDWAGSTNQRVIDVKKSILAKKIVLLENPWKSIKKS